MPGNKGDRKGWAAKKVEPQYILFSLSVLVLLFFIIAFTRPVYPASLQSTVQPSCTATAEKGISPSEISHTPTSTPELMPPTPEEIGYTNGIIFWATVMVFILLVGTLRETLRRKGK